MSKIKLATVWLDGCSGCHMSVLDTDERLVELSAQFDLVFSPLVDEKTFPEGVDVALVEGAVSSEEDLHKIRMIRARTKTLVSLGDCAVTGNVPVMRNAWPMESIFKRVYWDNAATQQQVPTQAVPKLLARARPVHEAVEVDFFIPGCPPSADTIHTVLVELLAGRTPDIASLTRFGA
jgi:NAD-reducing hydrogenase small subunit